MGKLETIKKKKDHTFIFPLLQITCYLEGKCLCMILGKIMSAIHIILKILQHLVSPFSLKSDVMVSEWPIRLAGYIRKEF